MTDLCFHWKVLAWKGQITHIADCQKEMGLWKWIIKHAETCSDWTHKNTQKSHVLSGKGGFDQTYSVCLVSHIETFHLQSLYKWLIMSCDQFHILDVSYVAHDCLDLPFLSLPNELNGPNLTSTWVIFEATLREVCPVNMFHENTRIHSNCWCFTLQTSGKQLFLGCTSCCSN